MTTIKKEKDESKKKIKKVVKEKPVKAAVTIEKVKTVKKAVAKAPVVKVAKTTRPRRKAVSKKAELGVLITGQQAIEAPGIPAAAQVNIPVVELPPLPVAPVKEEAKAPEIISKPEIKKEIKKTPVKEVKEEVLPVKPIPLPPAAVEKEIELELPINVKDLAVKLQEKPSVIIKILMTDMKVMAGINQMLDEQAVVGICSKFGFKIKKALNQEELALYAHEEKDNAADLVHRPPIVTLMGHVDHGKTSLLDAIRKSKLAEIEHGGITQHIGAYCVALPHGEITFLDTPGHEAFTAMRARGASVTDIVVLVVAADDGIMPQTIEAIDHARAAGVSIIVAVNKIDKPQADIDRVKKQLGGLDLTAEDWGGKTITVPVSAKTGEGIDNLLEMILLEAQMLELKANPKRLSKGVVIEAKISKGRGPVATLLVRNGTLHLNENIIVGSFYGKIRAMFNDRGQAVTSVSPAFPVEILGLSGVPLAGEQFFVIENEKQAKELALTRQENERLQQIKSVKRISLEDLHSQIKEGKLKELKIIIKADVQGSLEAIKQTLSKLNVSEIKLSFIHEGVGSINSSDVILAVASNALILGFNVMPDDPAKELIAKEGIDVRTYNIIYELANDIKAAIEGMLEPKLKKVFLGRVDIRKVFKLSTSGIVAGCFVTKGKITRSSMITLVRNGQPVFEGKISSLKRFKDDVREVAEGFECGITLAGFPEVQEGDVIEAYDIEKIVRKL
jgi:translation initiation factor IF-2